VSAKIGSKAASDTPAKYFAKQAAMNMHLSQPMGAAAFDGQHGISPAISSGIAVAAISSVIAICASTDASAIAGRDIGANASPTINKIESIRRMVVWLFTRPSFHKRRRIDSQGTLTTP
jgi:hypothetical protein